MIEIVRKKVTDQSRQTILNIKAEGHPHIAIKTIIIIIVISRHRDHLIITILTEIRTIRKDIRHHLGQRRQSNRFPLCLKKTMLIIDHCIARVSITLSLLSHQIHAHIVDIGIGLAIVSSI